MTAPGTPQKKRRAASLSPFHKAKAAFVVAGFASLVLSVALWFSGHQQEGLFVGLWVPAIHSLGSLILVGENRGSGNKHV